MLTDVDTGHSAKVVMPCRRKRLIHHGLVEQGYASRRICKILHLSHAHVKALGGLSDEALIEQIRVLAFQHKRDGYRRIWVLLRNPCIYVPIMVSYLAALDDRTWYQAAFH